VEAEYAEISIRRQCELLGGASWYYQPAGESQENLRLMRLMDEQYTRAPFYGSRRMTAWLRDRGHDVSRKRVTGLMQVMGIKAVYPKPNLSRAARQPALAERLRRYRTAGRAGDGDYQRRGLHTRRTEGS